MRILFFKTIKSGEHFKFYFLCLGEDIPDSIDYIVGGQPAELGEFPHVIILKYQGRFSCGGSLITPNRVLTAAHCVVDYLPGGSRTVEGLTITAGTINLESDGVIIPVESVHPHKDYNPADDFINDIAVIKVRSVKVLLDSFNQH